MKSRRLKWAWHVARMGEDKECKQNFVGKTSLKLTIWQTEEMGG
jgi:hypothetical protein